MIRGFSAIVFNGKNPFIMFTGLSALSSTENRGKEPGRVEVADWTLAEKYFNSKQYFCVLG